MLSVEEAWKRIERWLAAKAPKILGNLNSPAKDSEILAAEKMFSCEMPAGWRDLYRVHNGMNTVGNLGSLFHGMRFLSLEEAIHEHADASKEGDPLPVRAGSAEVRKAAMHNPRWIAFAHDGGDTLLRVDMDPDPKGKAGQVIFTDHSDDTVIILAPDMAEFLTQFSDDLEADRYFLDQDALADGNHFLKCDESIDVVNWASSPKWNHLVP